MAPGPPPHAPAASSSSPALSPGAAPSAGATAAHAPDATTAAAGPRGDVETYLVGTFVIEAYTSMAEVPFAESLPPPTPKNSENERLDALYGFCRTCLSPKAEPMLLCERCDRAFHLTCLHPPLHEPPKGEWFCARCDRRHHFLRHQRATAARSAVAAAAAVAAPPPPHRVRHKSLGVRVSALPSRPPRKRARNAPKVPVASALAAAIRVRAAVAMAKDAGVKVDDAPLAHVVEEADKLALATLRPSKSTPGAKEVRVGAQVSVRALPVIPPRPPLPPRGRGRPKGSKNKVPASNGVGAKMRKTVAAKRVRTDTSPPRPKRREENGIEEGSPSPSRNKLGQFASAGLPPRKKLKMEDGVLIGDAAVSLGSGGSAAAGPAGRNVVQGNMSPPAQTTAVLGKRPRGRPPKVLNPQPDPTRPVQKAPRGRPPKIVQQLVNSTSLIEGVKQRSAQSTMSHVAIAETRPKAQSVQQSPTSSTAAKVAPVGPSAKHAFNEVTKAARNVEVGQAARQRPNPTFVREVSKAVPSVKPSVAKVAQPIHAVPGRVPRPGIPAGERRWQIKAQRLDRVEDERQAKLGKKRHGQRDKRTNVHIAQGAPLQFLAQNRPAAQAIIGAEAEKKAQQPGKAQPTTDMRVQQKSQLKAHVEHRTQPRPGVLPEKALPPSMGGEHAHPQQPMQGRAPQHAQQRENMQQPLSLAQVRPVARPVARPHLQRAYGVHRQNQQTANQSMQPMSGMIPQRQQLPWVRQQAPQATAPCQQYSQATQSRVQQMGAVVHPPRQVGTGVPQHFQTGQMRMNQPQLVMQRAQLPQMIQQAPTVGLQRAALTSDNSRLSATPVPVAPVKGAAFEQRIVPNGKEVIGDPVRASRLPVSNAFAGQSGTSGTGGGARTHA